MTTDGTPGGPSIPAPNVNTNVVDFINSPMPTPSAGERDAALAQPVYTGPIPEVQAPPQPQTPQPVPSQPQVQQPQVEQPQVQQPVVPQPAPVQPPTPNYEQMYTQQVEQNKQFQARETAFETQRQEVEQQRQATQEQSVQNQARTYAMQQYQKYTGAGTADAQAQEWARADAQNMYQAYSFSNQQQQVQTQTDAIAQRYGVNASDIPSGMSPQAMEQFASMRSEINQVRAQAQTTSTNVLQQQTFDSNQGTAPPNPAQDFFNRIGDSSQIASNQDMAAMMQYMQSIGVQGV